MKKKALRCMECRKKATWICRTQFAGDHPFCAKHAEAQDNFGKTNPSYFVWECLFKNKKGEMRIIYAKEELPQKAKNSIFLAGPTPRWEEVKSWRPEALEILERLNFKGIVFVPEDRSGGVKGDYIDQVEWENDALTLASCILFWIPRDLTTLPAFTTNDEWGTWKKSGKVVLGTPPNAPKVKYQRYWAQKLSVPLSDTLEDTILSALNMINQPS